MRHAQKLAFSAALLVGLAPFLHAQATASGSAQTAANPLSTSTKFFYSMVMGSLVAAAEQMPDENYSFKATPDVRSFGQIIGHAADAQYMFCGIAAGETPEKKDFEHSKTSKADLVQALKDGQAYCEKVYGAMTDAKAPETVKFFGHDVPKLTLLSINTAHADEHYGNIVTYLRLKGMVPPTSQPRGK